MKLKKTASFTHYSFAWFRCHLSDKFKVYKWKSYYCQELEIVPKTAFSMYPTKQYVKVIDDKPNDQNNGSMSSKNENKQLAEKETNTTKTHYY